MLNQFTSRITDIIVQAGRLPGYKVHPFETYHYLKRFVPDKHHLTHAKEIYDIDPARLDKVADKIIKKHLQRFAATGAAVGAPGGPVAMFGGAVVDIEEYIRRMFLLTQELGHVYGVVPNPLTYEESRSPDDYFKAVQPELLNTMLVSLGGDGEIATLKAVGTEEEKREREKLDEELLYQVAVKIAEFVGRKQLKKHATKMLGRSVPLVGGGINGTLNYYYLNKLGKNMKKHLREEHDEVRKYFSKQRV
jgi:hypothetical protein